MSIEQKLSSLTLAHCSWLVSCPDLKSVIAYKLLIVKTERFAVGYSQFSPFSVTKRDKVLILRTKRETG